MYPTQKKIIYQCQSFIELINQLRQYGEMLKTAAIMYKVHYVHLIIFFCDL